MIQKMSMMIKQQKKLYLEVSVICKITMLTQLPREFKRIFTYFVIELMS